MSKIRVLLLLCTMMMSAFLYGCLKGEQEVNEEETIENNTNNHSENMEEAENDDSDEIIIETEEKVSRELYLIDENGLVVPQTLELPKTKSAAMQVMEYLVKDGPVTDLLPSGFEAVLPAGTEIYGVKIDDEGTLIVDVSEDFNDYDPAYELQILQSMTHTLTQFENVNSIKLWINGENQEQMPANHTPLSDGYSKANGINIDVKEPPNLQHTEAITFFYPKVYDDATVFVPVTKYISKDHQKMDYEAIVNGLIDGPSYDIIVNNPLQNSTSLKKKPSVRDSILHLTFDQNILSKDDNQAVIADEALESLVRTFTGQAGIDAVTIAVDNEVDWISESGKTYDQPMTVEDFHIKEKM